MNTLINIYILPESSRCFFVSDLKSAFPIHTKCSVEVFWITTTKSDITEINTFCILTLNRIQEVIFLAIRCLYVVYCIIFLLDMSYFHCKSFLLDIRKSLQSYLIPEPDRKINFESCVLDPSNYLILEEIRKNVDMNTSSYIISRFIKGNDGLKYEYSLDPI